MQTWADKAHDAGGDAPSVQSRHAFVLEERDIFSNMTDGLEVLESVRMDR